MRFFASKKKSKGKKRLIFLFFTVLILIFGGVYYVLWILRPGVLSMAKSRASEIATTEINRVVSERLKSENITVSDIVTFTYKENGDIAALSGNVATISKLKSDLALEVTHAINAISDSELKIPLGTLSGVDIFYGTGLKIPVKIAPYGYAVADIKIKFYDTGINQTVFEVEAEISAKVSVLIPTVGESQKITTTVPVVSAVIVGDVPESYTNVERHGEDFEDDVLEVLE